MVNSSGRFQTGNLQMWIICCLFETLLSVGGKWVYKFYKSLQYIAFLYVTKLVPRRRHDTITVVLDSVFCFCTASCEGATSCPLLDDKLTEARLQ